MLSHDLLEEAIETCASSRGTMTATNLQRRMHLGMITAVHLMHALEDAGVLGERGTGGKHEVLLREPKAARHAVEWAILDGRIKLDTPWTNEYGANMGLMNVGAIVRFAAGERAKITRMDLPCLGVVEILDPAGSPHGTGEKVLFHSLNVFSVEQAA